MLLGGIGAAAAGTSFQAFGYEIKCAGREVCTWTSWWEVAFNVLTVGAANAMVVGFSHACATGRPRASLKACATGNLATYLVLTAVGALGIQCRPGLHT